MRQNLKAKVQKSWKASGSASTSSCTAGSARFTCATVLAFSADSPAARHDGCISGRVIRDRRSDAGSWVECTQVQPLRQQRRWECGHCKPTAASDKHPSIVCSGAKAVAMADEAVGCRSTRLLLEGQCVALTVLELISAEVPHPLCAHLPGQQQHLKRPT